jgi:hypothetical protein
MADLKPPHILGPWQTVTLPPQAEFDETTEHWWCWPCHGLGGWEEDGADRGDFGDTVYIDCSCCGGDGSHPADGPRPACWGKEPHPHG